MRQNDLEFIVMLTHHDQTVENAAEIFETCRDLNVSCWGMKEKGIPQDELKELFQKMKYCGKTTFSNCILNYCTDHQIKYMPFVGGIFGRPSILSGRPEVMAAEANKYISKGAYGVDLLGYRYDGDASFLIRNMIRRVNGPVCVAGSIQTFEQIDEIFHAGAKAFTIGGAFFENHFGDTFSEQLEKVWEYVNEC